MACLMGEDRLLVKDKNLWCAIAWNVASLEYGTIDMVQRVCFCVLIMKSFVNQMFNRNTPPRKVIIIHL